MRHYEMMIILNPSQDERTVGPSLEKYFEAVRAEGGKIDKVDVWGKRTLAYPIEKQTEGIYIVVEITSEPAVVSELDRRLNLSDSVMRTKVLRGDR